MTKNEKLVAAAVLSTVPLSVWAQSNPNSYGRDWPGWTMMFGGVWGTAFWWIMPLLMMVFMIVVCFVIMRGMFAGHGHGHHKSGLRILGERLAKGEISKEEYEEKRKLLEDS